MTIRSLWKIYKFSKNTENMILETKKWKNRMYGYQKHFSSTCSEGFKSIQFMTSPENCAQMTQNIIWKHYWWTRSWGHAIKMVSRAMDFHGFFENRWCSRVPSTLRTKNYAANEVSRPKSFPRKKMLFFQKSKNRNIFGIFRLVKIQKFAIWPIRGCVRTYTECPNKKA